MLIALHGSCHCGLLRVALQTARPALPVRRCACGFCAPRRARWTSDPAGRLIVRVDDPSTMSRYRFGTRTADFLLCRECGYLVAAVCRVEDRLVGVANLDVLQGFVPEEEAEADFDGEATADRLARRARTWTPAVVA